MGIIALLFALPLAAAWPDGAPCVPTTFESMNPLEAVEHQGGLQLSEPPYEIETEQRCYWRGQPIAFTLQGKNESIHFKGFAIQPLEFVNGGNGRRVGRLLRLDDNGSWQYQCFRFHDSATHSHNQRKKHMKIWWRNDDDESRTVQFVATVVHSQKRFWVKSVYSRPIPPCRQQRDFGPYTAPMPVAPPPVKGFKMEADREFGNFFINEAIPGERGDGFPPTRRSVTRIPIVIPVPTLIPMPWGHGKTRGMSGRHDSTFNNNPSPSFAANFQQQAETERQRTLERQRSEQRQREMERDRLQRERERARAEDERAARERQRVPQEQERARAEEERRNRTNAERARAEQQEARQRQLQFQQQQQQEARQRQQEQLRIQQQQQQPRRNQGSFRTATTFTQQPQSVATIAPQNRNNGVCTDIDPPSRCIPWSQYCQASTYMHQYCRRTCHFC